MYPNKKLSFLRVLRRLTFDKVLLFALVFSASAELGPTDQPLIRINVQKVAGSIKIKGKMTITDDDGKVLFKGRSARFAPATFGLALNGHKLYRDHVKITSKNELVFIAKNDRKNARHFRNVLEVYFEEGELLVVHPLLLESYVAGIVASEIPGSWPMEAQKAQAIAARSYAVWQKFRRLNKRYHLESTVVDQVYRGMNHENAQAVLATAETHGKVITHNNQAVPAFYHSTCGGHTESALDAWQNPYPYLQGTHCRYCEKSPTYKYRLKFTKKELTKKLSTKIPGEVRSIHVYTRTKSGRVRQMKINTSKTHKIISANEFRRLIGYSVLKSSWIDKAVVRKDWIEFFGRGFGHGVGMCQWGAYGMARKGYSSEEIIKHYYKNVHILRMY